MIIVFLLKYTLKHTFRRSLTWSQFLFLGLFILYTSGFEKPRYYEIHPLAIANHWVPFSVGH